MIQDNKNPIGVFDSGYGGLSILKSFHARLPTQPFIYLGDHDNAPYGPRPKQGLFDLTTRNIGWLFRQNCKLVILACNTASSILRSIQHEWLPRFYPEHRVLGVVVPTIEMVTGVAWDFPATVESAPLVTVGVFATEATKEDLNKAVKEYVEKLRAQLGGGWPDYILLGCTHYALIDDIFRAALNPAVSLINQPDCITSSLENYLTRHPYYRGKAAGTETLLFTTGEENKVNKNGHNFLFNNAKFTTVKV
jgi:glutamate racemase